MDVPVDGPLVELVHRLRQELIATSERSAAAEALLEAERRERVRLEDRLAGMQRELAEARAVVYARMAGLHVEDLDGRQPDTDPGTEVRRRSISELATRLQEDQPPLRPPRRRFRRLF